MITIILNVSIGGIFLHLKQNDLTYHSTGKNITGKILIKENIKREV